MRETFLRRIKRIVKGTGVTLGLILLLMAAVAAYFRLDREHVFYEVRGTFKNAVILDSWTTEQSTVRFVELRNHRGEGVTTAYVRRPIELDPDYRIVVIYAGAKTREKILELIPDTPDLVLVSMQYAYESPESFLEHVLWPISVREAAFRTVAGGMLALSFIDGQEALDIERVSVIGVSVGVPFAVIHGALDERVPALVLIHGGGNLPAQVYAAARRRWLVGPAVAVTAIFFDSFEPMRYIDRIAPRKLIMIAARDDSLLPVENVEQLFAKAGEPKELFWTDSGHVRSSDIDLITDIIGHLDRYLE